LFISHFKFWISNLGFWIGGIALLYLFLIQKNTLTGNPWPRPDFKKLYPRQMLLIAEG